MAGWLIPPGQYEEVANSALKDLGLQLAAAQAEVALGSTEKANKFLDRAAGLDANHYRLHAIRGEIARIQEHYPEALKDYSAALANLPLSPVEGPLYGIQLHMDLMELNHVLGDEGAALDQLKIAQSEISGLSDQMSGKAQFLRLRSLIKMSAGDSNGALEDIKQALAINAHDRDDLQLKGDILLKLDRIEEAIAVYKQILAIDPVNQFALTSLGYASRAAGRNSDAEKYFQRLAHADPSLYVPYLALGDLYTASREFPRAEVSYGKGYALGSTKSIDSRWRHERRNRSPRHAPGRRLVGSSHSRDGRGATNSPGKGTIPEFQR